MRAWVLISFLLGLSSATTPTSYLSQADTDRYKKCALELQELITAEANHLFCPQANNEFQALLKSVLKASLGSTDATDVSYSVLGLTLLGEPMPDAQKVCQRVSGPVASITTARWTTQAAKALKCAKNTPELTKLITAGLASDSVADLTSAVFTQNALGMKVDTAAALKGLQAAVKNDDSLPNLGNAFHLAAALDPAGSTAEAKAIFDRMEDAIVQADEVDEKMLQFEGGLSVTNLIVSGVYRLSANMKKAPPISKQQAVQFANYFLSRKSVQSSKGAFNLVDAITTLTNNPYHIPVAVTLTADSNVVSEATPIVKVKVGDLFGNELGQMDVTVDSAMRQSDGAVIMSKNRMEAASKGMYKIDMMKANPGRGFYELKINANPVKADARLVGNSGATLLVKALGSILIMEAEIGIADADQTLAPKMSPLEHPKKMSMTLEADHHHKVLMKFSLQDKSSKDKVRVHQAFVRLHHVDSGSEIIFVAEPDSNQMYRFDLDVSSKAKDFGGRSGKYEVHLILGDAVISNPVNWHLADINLAFPAAADSKKADSSSPDAAKPEIHHLFREPEKRPPAAVSNLFTLLCLAPFLVMIVCWLKLGVNVSAFPLSLTAIGFHLGLAGIFVLYYYFWLQLNMFTTMKYLMMVGVVTFLCGNSLLVGIADRRKKGQ